MGTLPWLLLFENEDWDSNILPPNGNSATRTQFMNLISIEDQWAVALTEGYLQMASNVDQTNIIKEKEKLSLGTFISDVYTTGECLTANQAAKSLHDDTKNTRKAVKCLKSHCNMISFPTYPTEVNGIIVKTQF